MKVAVVGSNNLIVLLSEYIPAETTEILSGGVRGVDACARMYAELNGIPYREFAPDYKKYGRKATLKRNDLLICAADLVLAFWDGKSRSTKYVIDRCREIKKPIRVYTLCEGEKQGEPGTNEKTVE